MLRQLSRAWPAGALSSWCACAVTPSGSSEYFLRLWRDTVLGRAVSSPRPGAGTSPSIPALPSGERQLRVPAHRLGVLVARLPRTVLAFGPYSWINYEFTVIFLLKFT